MAPKKRTAVEPTTRVTRSSARLAAANPDDPKPELPKAKKPKRTAAAKSPAPEAEKEERSVGVPAGKAKQGEGKGQQPSPAAAEDGRAEAKTVVIEHCKQCNSFKTRALKVKEGLEAAVAGVKVVVNPEKPRKGCFEIREEDGGETFVSLLNMKRPFKPMKDLDMDEVIAGIIDKIK